MFIQAEIKIELARHPDSLEDLKLILSTISNTKKISLDVEMRIADIIERFFSAFLL